MTDSRQQNGTIILVHWTYSAEEWKRFIRWKKRKKGIFHYLLYLFKPKRQIRAPYVIVTYNDISTHISSEPFHTVDRKLSHSNIHDAGKMNIMEMVCEETGGRHPVPHIIYLPVPKGKLREAIQLQESLLAHHQQLA